MQVDVTVNTHRIARVIITRTHPDGGPPDRTHTYKWHYSRDGANEAVGEVEHTYGDGAIALAHKVLGEISERHRIADLAEKKHRRGRSK